MNRGLLEERADAIEEFVGKVETYEEMVEAHQDGRVETERVERYIQDGLQEESTGLVDSWVAAADAAEELRDHDRSYEIEGQDGPSSPQRPETPDSPGIGDFSVDLRYDRMADDLWDAFYQAQQTITEHESYALGAFVRSPVQHRMEVDTAYRERVDGV